MTTTTTPTAHVAANSDTNRAKLEIWLRMAKTIIRAYNKMPMSKYNVEVNKELSELAEKCRELEPSLKVYYPLD